MKSRVKIKIPLEHQMPFAMAYTAISGVVIFSEKYHKTNIYLGLEYDDLNKVLDVFFNYGFNLNLSV